MTLQLSGPDSVLERIYSDDFKVVVEHIEGYLKHAPIQEYDGERFVEVSLILDHFDPLYEDFKHRDPVSIPCDDFMEEMVIKHYEAAGWHRVQEYSIGTFRFYFKPAK